jgi:hypothetical protein
VVRICVADTYTYKIFFEMAGNKKDSKTSVSDASKKNEEESVELVIYLF